MIAVDPSETKRLLAKYGCSVSAPSPEPIKPQKRHYAKRERKGGKNITVARNWIAQQSEPFTHRDLTKFIGMDRYVAKHAVWRLHNMGEVALLPRTEFENHNHPRRYLRKV